MRLKIAFLNPTIIMRRPIAELAFLLAEQGHQIAVITPKERKSRAQKRHYDRLLEHPRIEVVPIWSKEIKSILWSIPWDRRLFSKVKRIMKEYSVLQIWAPYYIVAVIPLAFKLLRPRSYRAKVILTFDTFPGYSFSMGSFLDLAFKIYHHTLGRVLFRAADTITLYGKALLRWARKFFPQKKIVVIPTGVFLERREVDPRILQELKKRFKPNEEKIVLFVGILNRRKGVDVLLKALRVLQSKKITFKALIIGEGPRRKEFEKLAKMLGLKKQIEFLGSRSDVPLFYRLADVFVLPSRGEGLPGVVMEALSAGVPVVASDIPCLPDLVEDGKNGFLFPMDNAKALSEKLYLILSNQAMAQKFSKEAKKKMNSFAWDKVAKRYVVLYTKLLEKT